MSVMTDTPMAPAPTGVDSESWDAACLTVRQYCGWHIAPSVTETLTLDGPGGSLLRLPSLYVTAVTEVVNRGSVVTDPQWSQHGMVRGRWTDQFRGITVTLTHGYDECPADIMAVLEHMANQGEAAETVGVMQSMTAGPFAAQASTASLAGAVGLSGQHRGVLDRYKLAPSP